MNPKLQSSYHLLLLALAAAMLGISPPSNAAPQQGPDGNFYEVVLHPGAPLTWAAAVAEANSPGGHTLATIRSEAVDLFVEQLRQAALSAAGIDPFSTSAPPLWIGGSQGVGAAQPKLGWSWQFTDGPIPGSSIDPGYSNWLAGEPNDYPSPGEDGEEDFVAIGFQGQFGWNDRSAPCIGYVVMQRYDNVDGTWGPLGNPANGHDYEFVLSTRGFTWEAAEEESRCRSVRGRTGHLATITSASEAAFLESFRVAALTSISRLSVNPDIPATHPPLWIGGRQGDAASATADGWVWIDGSAVGVGHSDWIAGQPDDAPGTGVEDGEQDHLALGRGGGGWSDEAGSTPLVGYIVEYEDPIPHAMALRSTHYGGNGAVGFPYRPGYTRNVAMSVEAWVYREAGQTFQTILSQGFSNSYWLGFAGGKLRFYRSGGSFADSAGSVPINQWTHIAISYDGSFVRFYIDGESAGEHGLANSGTGLADDIYLGRDPGVSPFYLNGSLDEVRLWSTTRSLAQIRAGMCQELRGVAGLEEVWAHGGIGDIAGSYTDGTPPEARRGGILPKELVVPAARQDPTFDGNVDLATEYAGAEQIVLRYADGPAFKDATAYLVHTKNYLYIGIEGARLPAGGVPSPDDVFTAYLDGDGATTSFDPDLVQGRVFLEDGLGGYSRVKPVTIGAITTNVWSTTPAPAAHAFQSRLGTQVRDELSSAPDMEFRFHRSLLGDFDSAALDRLALSHTANGGPHGDRWVPEGGSSGDPATWIPVRYYPLPDPDLPLVSASGRVVNSSTGTGVPGVAVVLRGVGTNLATTTTGPDGRFDFIQVGVTRGVGFEIAITPPSDSLLDPASVAESGIQPASLSPTVAVYDGCPGGLCGLAALTFSITPPIPQTELGTFAPARVWPPVLVRGGTDPRRLVPSTVRVDGTNLHALLDFYFARLHCPNDLLSSSCATGSPTGDYFLAPATFVPASDGEPAHYLVETPDIAEIRYGFMRLVAHDRWDRPGNVVSTASSWRNAAENISVGPPPYELLHGFHFKNISDGHDLDDYRAAFYDQVCDPRYMVGFWAFSPIYLSIFGNGECLGITATAQQFARGRRSTAPLDPDVFYGNGFRTLRQFTGEEFPVLPATFDVSNPCAPDPINVWAAIKANHGVQSSSEFVGKTLEQFRFGPVGDWIDIGAQLDKIRGHELEWMLCIRNGAKGHCVQPLRVIDTADPEIKHIEIWDNNFPEQVRTIDVDLGWRHHYTYDGGFEGGPWTENWLLVYRVDPLYDGSRHVPSIDTAGYALGRFGVTHLWDLLQLIVSGDAEPLLTAGDNTQTGWDAAGDFITTGEQTVPIPNFNWIPGDTPPLGHYPVSMHHRMDLGAPDVRIFNRGNDYKFHSSHHGTMFQMFVGDGIAGASDHVTYTESAGRVLGYTFEAGLGGRDVKTRIALCKDAAEYPGAVAVGAVRVFEGTKIGIETLADGSGFQFRNDTGGGISPNFNIVAASQGSAPDFFDTPPLTLPKSSTLTVFSPDGFNYRDLVFQIDYDRDGVPEESWQFDSASGSFIAYVAPPEPTLSIAATGEQRETIVLTHPVGLPDWWIESSDTLEPDSWEPLDPQGLEIEIIGDEVFTYLPRSASRAFFRFARKGQQAQ